MKDRLEQRLQELKREFDAGQKALVELERQQSELRDTLLRISGAAQVLEEELRRADHDDRPTTDPPVTPERDGHLAGQAAS